MFLSGVDHVKWMGQWCERTRRAAYHETNRKKYGTKAAWETNTLARLDRWGFNLLGAGCDPDLRHRGLAHTIYLDVGGKMAKKGGECAIRPNPGNVPCGGFPNVFSPEWERTCEQVAQEMCAKAREDPDLVGYFIDNELAWWGNGGMWEDDALAGGLFNCVAALPPEHSARKALDGQTSKVAFLERVAERYFSVATAAIRRADPNHLILGCRFAGCKGAHEVVWRAAGRHCDIVTFNCYPWVDLDSGEVMAGTALRNVRFDDALAERYNWTQKPFMVTEWSFPALDSGLPCLHGAGQRFRTQDERTQATEIFLRAMMASGPIVGHSYFMWVDEPYWGIRKELPEDSNYGLLNENDEPYPLVDVFVRLRGLRSLKGLRSLRGLKGLRGLKCTSQTPQTFQTSQTSFSRTGDSYSLRNHKGLVLKGRIGGKRMFDTVTLCGVEIGSWTAMLHYEKDGKPIWRDVDKVTDVKWNAARGILVIRAEGGSGEFCFAITHEITLDGDRPCFLARCAKVENVGRAPLDVRTVHFRQYASYAAATVNKAQVPSLWKEPKRAEWNDPATGRKWGLWTNAKDADSFFRYYVNAKDGSVHPDAGFKPHERVVIAPGAVYVPPKDCSWAVAEADSTDHSKEAKVK